MFFQKMMDAITETHISVAFGKMVILQENLSKSFGLWYVFVLFHHEVLCNFALLTTMHSRNAPMTKLFTSWPQ